MIGEQNQKIWRKVYTTGKTNKHIYMHTVVVVVVVVAFVFFYFLYEK
jgi:hypothetical protein